MYPELNKLKEITDKEKVYTIAQNMSNTGFSIMKQKIDEKLIWNWWVEIISKGKRIYKEDINTPLDEHQEVLF